VREAAPKRRPNICSALARVDSEGRVVKGIRALGSNHSSGFPGREGVRQEICPERD
jgi:hypothetical protein